MKRGKQQKNQKINFNPNMAYSTLESFQSRVPDKTLIALTDPDNKEIDEDKLNKAITTADSIIDSYLSKVTDEIPLAEPPAFIEEYSVVIALKNMQKFRANIDIPEWAKSEYDNAIKHLQLISEDRANIVLAPTVTKTEDVTFEDAAVIFTRGDN